MDQRKPAVPPQAPAMSGREAACQPSADEATAVSPPAPALDQMISNQLRALYDEVVNEPIPDRFVKLLDELERKQAGKS